jgi:hypothetical protein
VRTHAHVATMEHVPMSRYVVQRRWTRDARIPLIAGDWDFEHGWQCVPLPPALDEGWEIVDTSRDRKTGWARIIRFDS